MSVFDLDNYTDALSDAADSVIDVATSIHDAGKHIGAVLKGIAPVIAMYPGIGTAFSVAVYAAGATAAKDRLDDAAIGMASTAMPPGLPRIAFDGAANIAQDVVAGRNIFASTLETCRQVAGKAGGAPAVAAFDSGVSMARGGPVDPRVIAQGRNFALQSGGQAAAASFDAGVAIAQGQNAEGVVLNTARGYVGDMGGPEALVAFDMSIALAYGKTLQDAGYIGLHTLVAGNDGAEKVLAFIEKVAKARNLGIALQDVLESDLVRDFQGQVGKNVPQFTPKIGTTVLAPYMAAIKENMALLEEPAGKLAQMWDENEAVIRAAQAAMRTGTPDETLIAKLVYPVFTTSVGKQDAAGMKNRNDGLAAQGYALAKADSRVMAMRSKSGAWGQQKEIDEGWRRGFDIGTAVTKGYSTFGPGQAAFRDSIPTVSQYNGFNAARDLQYQLTSFATKAGTSMSNVARSVGRVPDQTANNAFASQGMLIAARDPRVAAARRLNTDPLFLRGFDVAVGACSGKTDTGPGQTAVRESLGPAGGAAVQTVMGFNMGQALVHGIAKEDMGKSPVGIVSADPGVAVGQLVTAGLAGSSVPSDQKAAVVASVTADALARQGVQSGIAQVAAEQNQSLWSRFLAFFGF